LDIAVAHTRIRNILADVLMVGAAGGGAGGTVRGALGGALSERGLGGGDKKRQH